MTLYGGMTPENVHSDIESLSAFVSLAEECFAPDSKRIARTASLILSCTGSVKATLITVGLLKKRVE